MVEIKRVDDAKTLLEIGADAGEFAFAAMSDGEMLGYCSYRLDEGNVILRKLFDRDGDMVLADGIVRAIASAHRNTADKIVVNDEGDIGEYRSFFGTSEKEITIENYLKTNCQ